MTKDCETGTVRFHDGRWERCGPQGWIVIVDTGELGAIAHSKAYVARPARSPAAGKERAVDAKEAAPEKPAPRRRAT